MGRVGDIEIAFAAATKEKGEFIQAVEEMAGKMAKSIQARSMVAKPIREASIIPPYGTIIRTRVRQPPHHAMILGRGTAPGSHYMNVLILDEDPPYLLSLPDRRLLGDWEIVSEAHK